MHTGVSGLTPIYLGATAVPNGKVRDDVWQRAEVATGFHIEGSSDHASRQTRVRVCYDRSGLHFLIECSIRDPQQIVATRSEGDPNLSEDDAVAILISPYSTAGLSRCHHFVVNAAGAKLYIRPDMVKENESWRAAAAVLRDHWIANVSIPFQTLRPLGRNEDCWRANFRRHDVSSGEWSCWSPVADRFESCECMGKLIQPDAPFRFVQFRGIPAPIKSAANAQARLTPVTGSFPELWPTDALVPEPQEMRHRITKAPFRITPDVAIVVNADLDEASLHAAREINALIERRGGTALEVVPGTRARGGRDSPKGLIIIGESARNPLLKSICEADEIRMPRSRYGTGSHVVDVLPGRVVVAGTSSADTFNGIQTLKQLLTRDDDGSLSIPSVAIRDFPRFSFRAVHVEAGSDAGSFVPKLIDRLIAPLKFNHLLLQFHHSKRDRLGQPDSGSIEQVVPDIIKTARASHIAVTPVIELGGWPESSATDAIDHAIALFDQPEYVHVGNCGLPAVHEHVRSRGCRAMAWGDAVAGDVDNWLGSGLLRETVICERCETTSPDYPRIARLLGLGLTAVGCPSCDPRSIHALANQTARLAGPGIVQRITDGCATEQEAMEDHAIRLWSCVPASAWSWNPTRPDLTQVNYVPRAVFEKLWSGRQGVAGKRFAVVDLDGHFNITRADSGRVIGWLGQGRGNDLRELPAGIAGVGGVPFRFGPSAIDAPGALLLGGENMASRFPREVREVRIDSPVRAFHIVHACAYSADVGARVGAIAVHYADGETVELPLVYGRNTYAWDDEASAMAYCFAWRHRARDGRMIGVCRMFSNNPRPETSIESLDFTSESPQACPFFLAVTAELP